MTADGIPIPPSTPCGSCRAPTITVEDRHGKPDLLDAHPDGTYGTVWIHGITGRLVAQRLGGDAAKAYRRARHPIYKAHRCRT